ncbi:MAG: PcfJ domain-containing protein, partial [Alphaproteobacteria bacterium]|nr:PcfJ domain-containing protein [Alphaproteobacteria bacterium]
DSKTVQIGRLRLVCVWKWFCGAEGTRGRVRVTRAWAPAMRFATARDAAREWLESLLPELDLGGGDVSDVWLTQAQFQGYDFIAIKNAADMRAEALAMDNCVRRYARSLAQNHTRLWSVRRDGVRLATVAIGYRYGDLLPMVAQLRGPKNLEVSRELAWIVRRWLNAHDLFQVQKPARENVPLDRAAWTALWRPYWVAKGRIPQWLPLAPSRQAVEGLDA